MPGAGSSQRRAARAELSGRHDGRHIRNATTVAANHRESRHGADCSGRVALGGCPPRAPTDPYVVTLDHTVPRVTRSLCRDLTSAVANPYSAFRWYCGDTRREVTVHGVKTDLGGLGVVRL